MTAHARQSKAHGTRMACLTSRTEQKDRRAISALLFPMLAQKEQLLIQQGLLLLPLGHINQTGLVDEQESSYHTSITTRIHHYQWTMVYKPIVRYEATKHKEDHDIYYVTVAVKIMF